MTCDEISRQLDAYLDGELDLTACLKVEEHLAVCPICRSNKEERGLVIGSLKDESLSFKSSPYLETRIYATLREKSVPSEKVEWKLFSKTMIFSVLLGGVTLLILAFVISFHNDSFSRLAQEGVANHIRSLDLNHLLDVVSTDQHTVKPWFHGRLDFAPQVVDLAVNGYPLIGGRLDILDMHRVAALVYQRRKHEINLFIWPGKDQSSQLNLYHLNGYQALGWAKSGMMYMAVSDLNENELREFVELIQTQTN